MSSAKKDIVIYPGSCHCGLIQYKVRLALPPDTMRHGPGAVYIYKCNCSTCQKMGMFHCRPAHPTSDFVLLSPDSIEEMGDYRCFSGTHGWFFCKTCGCRVFGMGGKWERASINVQDWEAGKEPEDGAGEAGEGKQKVWISKPDGVKKKMVDGVEKEVPMHYLSVNAVTIETACEGGVDLMEWYEKGWVAYVDNRTEHGKLKVRVEKPYEGGMV